MKAPSGSNRISKAWIQYVLEEHLKKKYRNEQTIPEVDIKDFVIGQGAKLGDAFNSELVSLDVTTSLIKKNEIGETTTEDVEFNFMVKFLSTDAGNRALNQRFQTPSKEYTMYAEYIDDLNAMQSSHSENDFRIHIPDLIYGKLSEKEFVLVMENIKYSGYQNNDKYEGLDFKHLKEAVSQLARLHSLSYVYNTSQPVLKKYPFLEFNTEVLTVVLNFFTMCVEMGIDLLNSIDKVELAKKVSSGKEKLINEFLSTTPMTPGGIACSLHGDFWNNNIMFKEEETEGVSGEKETKLMCKIVDWGTSSWASPVYDLQYLMHTSTTRGTRKEHLEEILKFYHTTFTDIVASFGLSVPNWNYEDFLKEWKRFSVYGFFMGMCLTQGTLSKSNPVNKPKGGPSVLDNSFCVPAKYLVDGIKASMSKSAINFILRNPRNKLLYAMMKKVFSPMKDEILSGTNEAMNERMLGLFLDGDEMGLFDG